MVDLLAEHDLERCAREDSSLRDADVYRLDIRLPRRREKLFTNGLLIHVDWQEPWFLPRRFRNHCSFDVTQARYYCSNHCGSDHEFYYCSKKSFGCCHIGVGYCDWDGLLRCHW